MNQFNPGKILKHLERIVEWQRTEFSRPITYELDMTNRCNSKCPYCFGFANRENDSSFIDIASARNIIGQIKDFGGKGLTFTGGGEPLCNRDTIKAVQYAAKTGLDVGFITNGILLDEKKAEILVNHCTWIRVSLDAGTRGVYKITHGLGPDVFDKVVRNISVLVKKKKERKSKVTIGTGFITFPDVADDMVAYTELSRRLGVDYAQFRPLLKNFQQKEINVNPEFRILKNIEECQGLKTKTFNVLCSIHKYNNMSNGSLKRDYAKCYGHHFATVISANKKMYLCCHVRGLEKYCLGDLAKDSLEEIWKSERRRTVGEKIDFADCPLLCRCDGFNRILWNIAQPAEHSSFL
jgi:MoaA/NifB/PqqE/SkfB family radical SAM enzyme